MPADLLFPFVGVGDVVAQQDRFEIKPEKTVTEGAAACIAYGVLLRELAIAWRGEEFPVAVSKNFQSDRV